MFSPYNNDEDDTFRSSEWIEDFTPNHVDILYDPTSIFESTTTIKSLMSSAQSFSIPASATIAEPLSSSSAHSYSSTSTATDLLSTSAHSSSSSSYQESNSSLSSSVYEKETLSRKSDHSSSSALLYWQLNTNHLRKQGELVIDSEKELRSMGGGDHGLSIEDFLEMFTADNNADNNEKNSSTVYVNDPTDLDVLLGRGARSNRHAGNKRYLQLVLNMKALYRSKPGKKHKTKISKELIDKIHQYGGRFLQKEKGKAGKWYVVHDKVARKKASQALREDNTIENRKARREKYKLTW